MNIDEQPHEVWAARIKEIAASFPFPETPDIAGKVQQQAAQSVAWSPWQLGPRLAWAALLLLLLGLLAVPGVRAAIVSIFHAGAITIFVGEPTPVPPTPSLPDAGVITPVTATPLPLAVRLTDIATQVTLEEAQTRFRLQLQLPSALGEPDAVWLHQEEWYTTVIYLWSDTTQPGQIRYSLYQIDAQDYAYKTAKRLTETTVNGSPAFWIEGPHVFQLQDGRSEPWSFVTGSVLVWWADTQTFRLEGFDSLDDALQAAESLQPVHNERRK